MVDANSSRKLTSEDIIPALGRHLHGDWGRVNRRYRRTNPIALRESKPVRSVYFTNDGVKFSVVTNAERSATLIKVLRS
jgi:hypothetical protein